MQNHEKLLKNLIDLIIEEQAKLGYRKEEIRLYYPLESLRHFYGESGADTGDCSADEMQQLLDAFSEYTKPTLGRVEISHKGNRFCFVIPPQGSEYVHEHYAGNDFIQQLVGLLAAHATLEDVKQLFEKQPYASEVTPVDNGEFDVLIRFTEGDDPYYYCFKDEGCHVIYHRFLPADYEDFGF